MHQIGIDLAANVERLGHDLATDLKAECAHIADPAQCGSIVRRHFDGIVIALYLLMGIFMIAAIVGTAVYTAL